MALRINYNEAASKAQRGLAASQDAYSSQAEALSSGLRINKASDDAAGMAVSERLKNQVRGLNQAQRNAQDGISMIQTAEGGLSEIANLLARMRELAVQSANSTNDTSDRANLNEEYTALATEVSRVLEGTKFNGKNLLNADAEDMAFQIGADTDATDRITVALRDMTAGTGMAAAITGADASISTVDAALTTISNLDAAIDEVTSARSNLGSVQNRFESVVANLATSQENITAARGRITDADFAVESANLSRAQVLSQAGNTMLAQANQQPQQVLSLLR